jgi:hypothetical protein
MCNVNHDTINNTGNGNDLSNTQKIPQQSNGKHVIKEEEKLFILPTAEVLREVLMLKYKPFINGKWHLK